MDERDAHKKLEELVGVERAFKLMRMYSGCTQSASQNSLTLRKQPTIEERFRRWATEEGYSQEAIDHYLNYIR